MKSSTLSTLCRYLLAPSVSSNGNFTWAGQVSSSHIDPTSTHTSPSLLSVLSSGAHDNLSLSQTLGDALKSDGRMNGTLNVTTIQCDQNANTCTIPVPAPAFALVFLTAESLKEVSPTSTITFATTATGAGQSIYIDPNMLATSNGHAGMENIHGATSPGSISAASTLHTAISGALALFVSALGAVFVARRW
jgi:hypothetical protein